MYAKYVSFNGPFINEHSPNSPAGRDVLDALVSELEAIGVVVQQYSSTDYSHNATLMYQYKSIDLEVGPVGDEHAQWLMYFDLKNSFFGIRDILSHKELSSFSKTLGKALGKVDGITGIRWYKNAKIWNYKPDQFWSTPHA